MAPRRFNQRTSPLTNFGIAVALLVGLGAAGYGVANYYGLFDSREKVVEKSRKGLVPVPRSLVALKAFEKIEREDVYDRALGDESYFWLPKEQVDAHPEWVTRVDQVIGRVMARDKRAEFVFSDKDFLPEGSRTGLSGGVPDGKQGFFLEAQQIPGLRLLKIGDRFDLMASLPEESANAGAEYGLLVGGIKALGNKPIPLNGVRLLVQSGMMIALTNGKAMTTQGALEFDQADSRGRPTASQKEEQVAIAIDAEEVVPLTQALGAKLTIHAIARSGQKNEPDSSVDELAGLVPFPAAAVGVKAFSRITARDLAEPLTGELRQYYFKPGAASDKWIGSVSDLLGRVVRRDIDAGYIFSEDDFLTPDSVIRDVKAYERVRAEDLANPAISAYVGRVYADDLSAGQTISESDLLPPNASPGIAGGIPTGRMAVSIPVGTIAGLGELTRGNQFDLIASAPFDLQKELGSQVQFAGGAMTSLADKAVNTVLAVNAIVIDRHEKHVTLAILPSEVAGITKALALKTSMFSIAKSENVRGSQPAVGSTTTELVSDADPFAEMAITELIVGSKRSLSAFRKSK